jgi:hypothetical protein
VASASAVRSVRAFLSLRSMGTRMCLNIGVVREVAPDVRNGRTTLSSAEAGALYSCSSVLTDASRAGCGIGPSGVPRPSLADYVSPLTAASRRAQSAGWENPLQKVGISAAAEAGSAQAERQGKPS